MRRLRKWCVIFGLIAAGYALGASGGLRFLVAFAHAQVAEEAPATDRQAEVEKKIEAAILAVDTAMRALIAEKRYVPAIEGPNAFAVTTGGGDMVQALEQGERVDPETYVGLYAGMAVPAVGENLAKDPKGMLTYNGKVIRMYAIPELRTFFEARTVLADDLRKKQ